MFWPLMKDCITSDDRKAMVDFVKTTQRFTNGPKVREFENLWSQWLGVDYSIFVSSGSTAPCCCNYRKIQFTKRGQSFVARNDLGNKYKSNYPTWPQTHIL